MSARALITGLSGFTGGHVAAALAARGVDVLDPAALVDGFDLTDPATIRAALDRGAPDHVLHLGAVSFVAHDDPNDFYRINTVGTVNLLEALAGRSDVRKLVVASSANIYGNARAPCLTEDTAPAPVNHYACSKLAMEHLVRQWFGRLPILVTRPFNYTGRGQAKHFVIPKIVDHFARRADILEVGNLDVARDFSDVRDVAAIYADLLLSPAHSEVVNICSGRAYALQWIIDRCAALTGHELAVRVNPAFVRVDEVKSLVGSTARLAGLVPVPTRDLADTLEWMLGDDRQGLRA